MASTLGRQSCPHCKAALPVTERNVPAQKCPVCGKPLATVPRSPAGWYYVKDGQRVGPLSAAQLKELAVRGVLSRTDQVCRDEIAQWVAAGQVKGLFDARPANSAPPVPPRRAVTAPAKAGKRLGSRHAILSHGHVVTEATNCVQCGICSYNCPMGIDVRAHTRVGRAILDSRCLTCGECVRRCPRGVSRFETIPLFGIE